MALFPSLSRIDTVLMHAPVRRAGISLVILLPVLAALLLPTLTAAQDPGDEPITIVSSFPRANAVLEADAPGAVDITFSTDVDPEQSSVRVLTSEGDDLDGTTLDWTADTATVTLPDDLPNGSWLVAWEVTAADSPAEGSGFYGFTVGADQDVAPLTIPDTGFDTPTGPAWLARIATAAMLLGSLVLIAIWPLSHLFLRSTPETANGNTRLQGLAMVAAAVAASGALGRLIAEAWSHPASTWPARLQAVIGDARPGWVLLLALGLVSLHSVVLALMPPHPTGWRRGAPWLTTIALAIPIALLSHAADEPAGRIPTLTVTVVALLALGMLAGSAIVLVWLRLPPPRRFGLLLATGSPVLLISGAYLAWLFTGNRTALEDTTYGMITLITIGVAVVFLIALPGAMLLARRSRKVFPMLAPVLLAVALTGLVGSLMVEVPARAQLARDASQHAEPFTLDATRAQLILAPGAAGVNHVRLEVDRASLPQRTTATMTLALPAMPEIGEQQVPLSRVSETAFEYHGNELIIADQWSIGVALSEPNRSAATASLTLDLAREATEIDVPPTPWRFTDFAGSAGVLMVVIGIAGLIIGIAAGRSPVRMESAGLGATALILAAILLGQGRLDPILAAGGDDGGGAINPDDLTMITRGEDVYIDHCLSCHGAELRGDGPASGGMQPPPADFAAPHTRVHDEATLIYWLRNGKQGTAMPAFSDVLSDDEIRAVLSYIEREQRAFQSSEP